LRKRVLPVSLFVFLGAFVHLLQPSTALAVQPSESSIVSVSARGHSAETSCTESFYDGGPLNTSHLRSRHTLIDVTRFKRADPATVTGVFVCRVLALDVAQQPIDNPVFVSEKSGTATQFRLAANYGTIGLLAHNTRSGAKFFDLAAGQEVDIVYGDGTIRPYVISEIRHFRALNPDDPYTNFVDLDRDGIYLSSTQVFGEFYEKGDRVVFQTCIDAYGNASWGRLFVIATPVSED
jgi:hypothetical protein